MFPFILLFYTPCPFHRQAHLSPHVVLPSFRNSDLSLITINLRPFTPSYLLFSLFLSECCHSFVSFPSFDCAVIVNPNVLSQRASVPLTRLSLFI